MSADMVTVRDILGWIEAAYPSTLAEDWDSVGLDVGDPGAAVTSVAFAVDPTDAVVAEAADRGAQLLITHHPLLLRGIKAVRADQPKGRVVMAMLASGMAHIAAHTNADHGSDGVSDALAGALGLQDVRPLAPLPGARLAKLVTFVPADHAETVLDALADAGAGALGDYDRCAFVSSGEGRFRPLDGAQPFVGEQGQVARVAETRIEVVLPRAAKSAVVRALLAAHPYETPAFDLIDLAPLDSTLGTGRVGVLPTALPAKQVAAVLSAALPTTATGVRLGGDPDRLVQTIGVVGGAGDSFLDAARGAGVDCYITGDLRHHPAQDFLAHAGSPVLIDVPHWAAESLWLATAESLVQRNAEAAGAPLRTYISAINTDPWTLRV